jgi:hypothetical protein
MVTPSSNLSWGAIVSFPNDTTQANVGGCIDLLDNDASQGSCAQAVEALDVCRHVACLATCPNGSTPTGLQTFQQCEAESNLTVCQPYSVAAQCDQSARYASCLFANFEAYFLGLGSTFCINGMDDGGSTDAAFDWPGD